MSKLLSDKEINRFFENDAKNIVPDTAIRDRLEYAYLVKSGTCRARQNSFLGLFPWLFSWAHLPFKVAIASVLLVFSFANIKTGNEQFLLPGQDTTLNVQPQSIDTSITSPFYADTCITSKAVVKKEDKASLPSLKNLLNEQLIDLLVTNCSTCPIVASTHRLSLYFPIPNQLLPIGSNNKCYLEFHFFT